MIKYFNKVYKRSGKNLVWSIKNLNEKKVREKSRECHNHKPQPIPDPKRTNLNEHKPNKRTKSTKISSLFPKRGNRNTKRTEKHKNKMTHGKTYNKSPRRITHKATKSKTNTGTTALERSVEQTTGGGGVKIVLNRLNSEGFLHQVCLCMIFYALHYTTS